MANMKFANNANTTLASSLTAIATTMSVTSATKFPVLNPLAPVPEYFYCTLTDVATQTVIEIVKVTVTTGTTWTITRGQDGTTGTAFAAGDVVSLRLVKASLDLFPVLNETNTFTGAQTANSWIPSSATVPTNGMYLPAANAVGFATNSTNAIYVNSSQNIGIGIASPSGKFNAESFSNGAATTVIVASNGNGQASTNANTEARIYLSGSTSATGRGTYIGGINIGGTVGGNNHALTFATSAAGASPTERMRIGAGVSIGNTTDPGATNLSVGPAAAGLKLASTDISGNGTNTNIDISITPKGAGKALVANCHIQADSFNIAASTTKTVTISGVTYGSLIISFGGYGSAASGYMHRVLAIGGYQTAASLYDVTTLASASHANVVLGAVTKNASSVTFTIQQNGATTLQCGYHYTYYGQADSVSVTIA